MCTAPSGGCDSHAVSALHYYYVIYDLRAAAAAAIYDLPAVDGRTSDTPCDVFALLHYAPCPSDRTHKILSGPPPPPSRRVLWFLLPQIAYAPRHNTIIINATMYRISFAYVRLFRFVFRPNYPSNHRSSPVCAIAHDRFPPYND